MSQRVVDIRDHLPPTRSEEAVGAAIQGCIDRCAAEGGGTVLIPEGAWPVRRLRLASRVMLRLAAGARLEGEVLVDHAEEAGVVGEDMKSSYIRRVTCRHSRQLTLKSYCGQTTAMSHCEGAVIRGLSLHQPVQRQGEGSAIWLVDCANLDFADCDLSSNDDVFCIKRSGRNISLRRSILRGHLGAAYKIGTESDGIVENITFTDSTIYNSDRAALSLESVDGAHMSDVVISGIRMVNVAAPLFIRLGNRDRFAEGVGSIANVSLSDIEAIGMNLDEGYGSSISGLVGHPVRNVSLTNVRFTYRGGGGRELAARVIPEREELYPEYDMFGKLPAWGLWCRHVQGLTLQHVDLRFYEPDLRPAIVCDDVEDVEMNAVNAMAWPGAQFSMRSDAGRIHYRYPDEQPAGEPAIELRNVSKALIQQSRAPMGVNFVRLRGGRTGQITLRGNVSDAVRPPGVEVGEEVTGEISIDPALEVVRIGRWEEDGRASVLASRGSAGASPSLMSPMPGLIVIERTGAKFVSLSDALAAARACDILTIEPGEHRLEPGHFPLILDKPGLTIRSVAGAETTRIVAVGASETALWDGGRDDPAALRSVALFAVTADDVTIEGLTLRGALYNVLVEGASNCTIRNNHLDFSKRWHIYLRDGKGHQIIGNTSRAALNCVVRMERCEGCIIRGHISHEDPAGFRLSASRGNTIEACEFQAISWWAVMLEIGSDGNVIKGNQLLDGRMSGIQVRGCRDARIEGNAFIGHKTEAILIDRDASGVRIHGNSFDNNLGLAVSNETANVVDATDNWWGAVDGPSGAGPGSGDMVDGNVLFEPWCERPK